MPYNSDDEEEMELEDDPMVEVMAVDDDDDDNDEQEDLSKAATTSVAAEDDESTEEDNDDDDDDDTDSEPEMDQASSSAAPTPSSLVVAAAPRPAPPKMRIKLKMPKSSRPPQSTNNASETSPAGGGTTKSNARSLMSLPLSSNNNAAAAATAAAASTSASKTSNSNKNKVVLSVGGSKPKPNLPLKRLPTAAGLFKKPSASGGGAGGDSSSLTGSASGKKSRIRTLKLPFSKKLPKGLGEDDDGGGDDDEAGGVATAEIISTGQSSGRLTPGGGTYTKRRSMYPSKPVKLPPLISPGLIVTQPSTGKKSSAELFDEAMQAAGYTERIRTERPHRGSSIQRQVGDLFDSNVKLTMHFPNLVPPELWNVKKETTDQDGDTLMEEKDNEKSSPGKFSPQDLIRELRQAKPSAGTTKKATISIDDMLPVSLTAPLPDSYIEERLKYVDAVEAREKAIVAKQAAEEEAEFSGADPPTDKVPPIPVPPDPPRLERADMNTVRDEHPLYPPKQASLASHLDPKAFHITDGRYFGLLSNNIADPSFYGPNANYTAGSALATAGSAAAGTALTLSTFLFSNHPPTALALGSNAASVPNNVDSSNPNDSATNAATPAGEVMSDSNKPEAVTSAVSSATEPKKDRTISVSLDKIKPPIAPISSSKDKKKGPTPTASASALRKLMEEGDEKSKQMRQTIIRAAVYASRTGGHGQSFVTPSGTVYPDIGKAFAAYAGIKPCERCKSNKQGSYHCRLRRKHRDLDFDGGTSFEVLSDLQQKPVESLLPSLDDTTTMAEG